MAALALGVTLWAPFTAAPPAAAHPGSGMGIFTYMEITVTYTISGRVVSTSLSCDPDNRTHPNPKQACDVLRKAGGDFSRIQPIHRACPHVIDPVIVNVDGFWRGSGFEYEREFINRCVADATLGDVTRF
ncbi:SSI family serine proteinase inhibitor [Spongiactinospora rosea]|uniref:SSI family serine proteinase inhibitor n=1 Tax=Spongiactinospora rosea TaxID=2248750 RepID=UPI001314439A|nr:SSI family serine proteinase inhibitor [Spongiactinospora rosea]